MRLLSVIGDDISQLIPVVYAYRDEITEHVLLYDDSSYHRAKQLERGMQKFTKSYQLLWKVRIQHIDSDDLSGVVSQLRESTGSFEDVWLNVSDASPMLTLLLGKAVQEGGGEVISYDHFSNKLHFLDKNYTVTCTRLHDTLKLHDYLMLLDFGMTSGRTRAALSGRKQAILQLYENQSRFKKLRYALLYHNEGFAYTFYKDLLLILDELGITRDNKLIPSQQKVLSGDLFEEYIFCLCEDLGVDDIAMGVKIDFDSSQAEPQAHYRVFNEFDILLMHQNRIYTIECKYATHLEGLELVYKYDAIIDYFGEAAKAILLNISNKPKERYLGMKSSSNFRHSALRRARRSNIEVYHESQVDVAKFQLLVKSFFHLGGEDVGER